MRSLVVAGLLLVGAVGLVASVRLLLAVSRDRGRGALRYIDAGTPRRPLRAPRLGLVGRPDEVRELPDGRWVPIEFKSRTSPRRGPPASHRVQVEAYCLLVEEATGRPPPGGVIRYGDGSEWEIVWDRPARDRTLARLRAVRRPYRGEATGTAVKCRRCGYRDVCTARVD